MVEDLIIQLKLVDLITILIPMFHDVDQNGILVNISSRILLHILMTYIPDLSFNPTATIRSTYSGTLEIGRLLNFSINCLILLMKIGFDFFLSAALFFISGPFIKCVLYSSDIIISGRFPDCSIAILSSLQKIITVIENDPNPSRVEVLARFSNSLLDRSNKWFRSS